MDIINKKKIKELKEDFKRWNIINTDTWEVVNVFNSINIDTKKRKLRNYTKYRVINIEALKEVLQLRPKVIYYFMILVTNLKRDNSVDFKVLWVTDRVLKDIKAELKEKKIIKNVVKWKKTKYFINPNVTTYWKSFKPELWLLFK